MAEMNVYLRDDGKSVEIFKMDEIERMYYSVTVPATQYSDYMEGKPIERAMPQLTSEQRDFLRTGLTPSERALEQTRDYGYGMGM